MRRTYLVIALFLLTITSLQAKVVEPVQWDISHKQIEANKLVLTFTATIENGWHLYGTDIPENGPIPTSVHYSDSSVIQNITKLKPSNSPKKKYDPNFDMKLPLLNDQVVFTQTLTLTDEDASVKGFIEYMGCDNEQCIPPQQEQFDFGSGNQVKSTSKDKETSSATQTSQLNKQYEGSQFNQASAQAPDTSSTSASTQQEAQKTISEATDSDSDSGKRSLWLFAVFAFLGGLAGILTPCVFPMIPMTISFFMQNNKNRIQSILSSLVFGISIIVIYTSIGVLVSLTSLGADFPKQLSTHWLPNTIFFTLFLLFALSFFGLFEIVLPGNIANKTDQQADRGGIIGAFFMALTLVLVSFSCTGPIVGAILLESAGGIALKPIVGMLSFAIAFALPFTLLSFFPSKLKSLPKSGGWLNSVKVVLGFFLLAVSLKFVSAIDQNYHLGLLSRNLYLAIWISIFTLMGFYILGKIKMKNDSEIHHINVIRLILAIITFSFVVYLIPGLFGAPLKPISPMLPAKTSSSFETGTTNRPAPSFSPDEHPTFCGNNKYADILNLPHDLKGYFRLDQGLQCARELNKPVLIDFKGHACSNCKEMESKVWSDPEVLKKLRKEFVIVALYVDDRKELPKEDWVRSKKDGDLKKTIGQKSSYIQKSRYNANTQPFLVITNEKGEMLTQPMKHNLDIQDFISFLKKGIRAFEEEANM